MVVIKHLLFKYNKKVDKIIKQHMIDKDFANKNEALNDIVLLFGAKKK